MLIRSQNKTVLVNMEAVAEIFIKDNKRICASFIHGGESCIGEYESEEVCIKVLDGIQKAYKEANDGYYHNGYYYNKHNVAHELPKT